MQVCVLKESSAACMLQSGKLVRVWCTFCAYERRKKQKKKLYLRLFFTSSAVLVMFLLLYTWPSHSPSLACWWLVLCCVRVFSVLCPRVHAVYYVSCLGERSIELLKYSTRSLNILPPVPPFSIIMPAPVFLSSLPSSHTHTHTYIKKRSGK